MEEQDKCSVVQQSPAQMGKLMREDIRNHLRNEGPATRRICIRKCLNGYIVEVGCETVVFESTTKLFVELQRYLQSPIAVENEYLQKGC